MNLLDERSDQVKEILGKTPNWMIRWGISVVFIIIVLLLVGSAIISYNDIIRAKVVITTKNPPIYLKARSSGKLNRVLVEPSQKVVKDQVLAEIENTANYKDILYLREKLSKLNFNSVSLDSIHKVFPSFLDLGELQPAYGNFLSTYQDHVLLNTLNPNGQESILIQIQLNEQKQLLKNQRKQLAIFEQELQLSSNDFNRNKDLFGKGVISKAEYEMASREFLADQQKYEGLQASISDTQIAIANFANLLSKSTIQDTEFSNNYRLSLENAYQNLYSLLLDWEHRFLIKSPINGKVTVFDVWNQYQNVSVDQTLFTVVPENPEGIIGRVTLPIRNSGKVSEGQPVIIKLDNYPFEEWGSLLGTIVSMSEVPKQGEQASYTLYIAINGLTTSSGKTIEFKQEMQGNAEIVLEELSILQRIFYQLRKAFT